ncbi:MAG: gamma-glutamyl-gamma-aminobutyrate hydrolase family protein [Lachnospiraceae bacterium]|jgi:putative glutamine amidotransferase|nr:gamma-glutamyl-gamma-aminobutyrate hydrolase family protein [Lachnospiraceae bacterium]
MKVAIIGRRHVAANYERYSRALQMIPVTTLSIGLMLSCDGVILPGGGDITPAFFGERDCGSKNIDTELDLIQIKALECCIKHQIPVVGICKGMQLINVVFGGTILQDLPSASIHQYDAAQEKDQHHQVVHVEGGRFAKQLGSSMTVNSAHHQGIGRLGKGLVIESVCPVDDCVEAISHHSYPILGFQWHPERMEEDVTSLPISLMISNLFHP